LSKVLKFAVICRSAGALGQKQMWCNCVSACVLGCTSFDFVEALAFLFIFCLSIYWSVCRFTMPYNGFGLGEGGELEVQMFKFSTKANRKYKCSI
jgi:hypothetical protein